MINCFSYTYSIRIRLLFGCPVFEIWMWKHIINNKAKIAKIAKSWDSTIHRLWLICWHAVEKCWYRMTRVKCVRTWFIWYFRSLFECIERVSCDTVYNLGSLGRTKYTFEVRMYSKVMRNVWWLFFQYFSLQLSLSFFYIKPDKIYFCSKSQEIKTNIWEKTKSISMGI